MVGVCSLNIAHLLHLYLPRVGLIHCTLAHFAVLIRGHTPHCGAQRLDLCSHMLSCGALEITYFVTASKILKVNANRIMFNTYGMIRRPNLQPHACKEGTLPLNYTRPLQM